MISKTNDKYHFVYRENLTSIINGGSDGVVYPMLNNIDYVMNQYDLIYGELPKTNSGEEFSKELILVVGKGNKVSKDILSSIGIDFSINESGKFNNISFEDLCRQEYKLIFNDDYYTADSDNFDEITKFDKLNILDQTALMNVYNKSSITLKISGVLRLKENATAEILSTGLAYMPDLEEYYAENCKESEIARKTIANRESLSFYDNYIINISEMPVLQKSGYATAKEINDYLNLNYGYRLSDEDAFELGLQQIGISSIPVGIRFYPKNFEGRDAILQMIKEYNAEQTNKNMEIVYGDTSAFLTSTLGEMVDIISYVLIAFASISLVVSSVMIGIITYSSVVERTKEIGVLRSIGARKKDISRIFNSETILVGFFAGLLGVFISWILTFPISSIICAVAGGAITTSMAILKTIDALSLIIISTLLTTIAGTVPARIASKKDPVRCLRSE